MYKITSYLVLFFCASSNLFAQNDTLFDFQKLNYTYAKAYLYNPEDLSRIPILKEGALNKTVQDTNGVLLDSSQANNVIQIISGQGNYTPDVPSFCFIPHHGIVFYNDMNEAIAHISICFSCHTKVVVPKTTLTKAGLTELEEIIRALGLPITYNPLGYTVYFQKQANG